MSMNPAQTPASSTPTPTAPADQSLVEARLRQWMSARPLAYVDRVLNASASLDTAGLLAHLWQTSCERREPEWREQALDLLARPDLPDWQLNRLLRSLRRANDAQPRVLPELTDGLNQAASSGRYAETAAGSASAATGTSSGAAGSTSGATGTASGAGQLIQQRLEQVPQLPPEPSLGSKPLETSTAGLLGSFVTSSAFVGLGPLQNVNLADLAAGKPEAVASALASAPLNARPARVPLADAPDFTAWRALALLGGLGLLAAGAWLYLAVLVPGASLGQAALAMGISALGGLGVVAAVGTATVNVALGSPDTVKSSLPPLGPLGQTRKTYLFGLDAQTFSFALPWLFFIALAAYGQYLPHASFWVGAAVFAIGLAAMSLFGWGLWPLVRVEVGYGYG